jgi:hypothetical protein
MLKGLLSVDEPTRVFDFKPLSRWTLASGLVMLVFVLSTVLPVNELLMLSVEVEPSRTQESVSTVAVVFGWVTWGVDAVVAAALLVAALLAAMKRPASLRIAKLAAMGWLVSAAVIIPTSTCWLANMAVFDPFAWRSADWGYALLVLLFLAPLGILPLALPMKVLVLVDKAPLWARRLPRVIFQIGCLALVLPWFLMPVIIFIMLVF